MNAETGIARMRQDGPLLEITGLRVTGESDGVTSEIVKGIDLRLKRGEVLGLIGESGAGKSTIGLAAMGYAKPGCRIAAGSVVFDGIDLAQLRERNKRLLWGSRLAYVAQSAAAAFNPAHRLDWQCTETMVQHGHAGRADALRHITQLFRRLRLPDPERIGGRFPHQVSGGQLQRAMTAMAMSCGPDLIVFDEPTTALDVTTQIEVLASIKELVRQSGTAAIYISHDLAVVAQMADRIMVLRHGLLVEEAPTATMLAAPREPYTKSLWSVRSLRQPERAGGSGLLKVEGVEAAYGAATVLSDIHVEVPRGRTIAVVGESGSGKSTLGKVIVGLLPPRKGRVLFDGKPLPPALAQRSGDELRRIQLIYQSPDTALNPKRTVREVLARPLSHQLGLSRRARDARGRELLDMVGLESALIDRLPADLSGGQKQRVSIARALAVNPELIICDEITSALDQIVAEGVLRLLGELQKELQISYLLITHDLAVVRAIADRVVVMQNGVIVDQGMKAEVLSEARHPYTRLLLDSVPEMRVGWLDGRLAGRRPSEPADEAARG